MEDLLMCFGHLVDKDKVVKIGSWPHSHSKITQTSTLYECSPGPLPVTIYIVRFRWCMYDRTDLFAFHNAPLDISTWWKLKESSDVKIIIRDGDYPSLVSLNVEQASLLFLQKIVVP